jgi:hypothetical protein
MASKEYYDRMQAEAKDSKDKIRQYRTAEYLKADAEKSLEGKKKTPAQIKDMLDTEKLIDKAQKKAEESVGVPDTGTPGFYEKLRKEVPIKEYKKGGKVSSASKRADGCAVRGKTRA